MEPAVVNQLNAINRAFYETTADEFDQTRGTAWPGWERLLAYLLPSESALSVLDVGCGNGRFGLFLGEKFSGEIHYHGIDNNAALLAHARDSLAGLTHLRLMLEQRDVVEQPPDEGEYDLVGVFGVLHHIPGAAQRRNFVRMLAERVKPGGLLAMATWRFYEFERFRARVVPWPDDLHDHVEAHDYLLDWRRGAVVLRYCHYVDDAEQAALIEASGLRELITYRADGYTGTVNSYSLLGR